MLSKETQKKISEETRCQSCGHELLEIVRKAGPKVLSLNFSKICTNEKCNFFVNFKNLPDWRLFRKDKFDEKFNNQNWPKNIRPDELRMKRDWKKPAADRLLKRKISSEF